VGNDDDDDDCHHQLTFSRRHHRPSRRGPAGHPVSLRPLTVDPDRMQRKTSGMGSRSILTVTATGQQLKQELVAGPALATGRRRCLDCHLAAPQRRLPLPRVLAGAGAHRTGGGVPSTDQLVSPSTRHPAGAQCSARSSSITIPSSRYPTTRSGLRGHARGRGIAIAAKPSRASATRPCIRGELGLPTASATCYIVI